MTGYFIHTKPTLSNPFLSAMAPPGHSYPWAFPPMALLAFKALTTMTTRSSS